MYKLDRKSYEAARRMVRLLAATCPDFTENQKRYDCWAAAWSECLSGMGERYGWPVAHAIGGSVFAWRSIAQRKYQWLNHGRYHRFAMGQSKARMRALGR